MYPYVGLASLCNAIIVLAPWLSKAGYFGRSAIAVEAVHLQLELVAFSFLATGFLAVFKRDVEKGLVNIAATWLTIGYAGLLTSFLTLLRCDSLPGENGAWVVLTIILVCKISDIGAYFTGSTIGKHKLIPAVSPGKSVEGMFGGIAASCLVSFLLFKLHQNTLLSEDPEYYAPFINRISLLGHEMTILYRNMSSMQAIIFGAVMAIVGQLGDLVESVFKRSAGTKDSAKILPEFGGVLDIMDSPLAIAPVAWFLLTRVWGVV